MAMQCKDIPDRPILEFLLQHLGYWCNWHVGNEYSVRQAMPAGIPEKLVLAKMRRLLARGLVQGCLCGCRGDFEITMKGRAFLMGEQLRIVPWHAGVEER